MSKLLSALVFVLLLAPAACDDGDDKPIERGVTGDIDDLDAGDESTGTAGDDDTGTTGDDDTGCLNALPPTGGPATTIHSGC